MEVKECLLVERNNHRTIAINVLTTPCEVMLRILDEEGSVIDRDYLKAYYDALHNGEVKENWLVFCAHESTDEFTIYTEEDFTATYKVAREYRGVPFMVQDFIYAGDMFLRDKECPLSKDAGDVAYARWVLLQYDVPADLDFAIHDIRMNYPLYCKYEDAWYRVTGLSRLGDVFLRKDLTNGERGYDLRVSITSLSSFTREMPSDTK